MYYMAGQCLIRLDNRHTNAIAHRCQDCLHHLHVSCAMETTVSRKVDIPRSFHLTTTNPLDRTSLDCPHVKGISQALADLRLASCEAVDTRTM